MIKIIGSISAALILILAALQTPSQKALSADEIMLEAGAKLASVKRLGYTYTFEYSYPSENRSVTETAKAYLDLAPADGSGSFKFQFLSKDRFTVYNGSERFTTDKKTGKLWLENDPSFERSGYILLMNSPLALKNALPKLAADKTISKKASITKVNGREQYIVEFSLKNSAISSAGGIFEIRGEQAAYYRLVVDKKTSLPAEVLQTNDKNDESVKSSFTELRENPPEPDALSWYYSSYQKDYQLENKDPLTLIEPGRPAPAFELAQFGTGLRTPLAQYGGKLVLLEFWIVQCAFCVAAVPRLNSISEKFASKGLEVVSINMHDSTPAIEFFKKKNKPGYLIMTGGDSIATAYGVDAFPAFVLIDPSGKVVYSSSGLQQSELEAAILSSLQE